MENEVMSDALTAFTENLSNVLKEFTTILSKDEIEAIITKVMAVKFQKEKL